MQRQMSFLEYKPNIEELRDQVTDIHTRTEKVRKSIYARHNELAKMYMDVKSELDLLKSLICKGKL